MDSQVGALIEQRFFYFLGEQTLGAHLGQRHVGNLVAGRLDDLDAALFAPRRQFPCNPPCLPQRQLRAARRDNQHDLYSCR
jgi:hypothetical protein